MLYHQMLFGLLKNYKYLKYSKLLANGMTEKYQGMMKPSNNSHLRLYNDMTEERILCSRLDVFSLECVFLHLT